jgi:hypothetical protein
MKGNPNMLILSWLRSLNCGFARGRRIKAARKTTYRPALELLEDRRVLATLYVVPGNVPADASNFHDLTAAFLAAAGSGDIVQIEPNSTPGGLDAATTFTAKNLIIRGDLGYLPGSLPLLDHLSLASGLFDLENLNLSSVDDKYGTAQVTLAKSNVADVTFTQSFQKLQSDTISGTVLLQNSTSSSVKSCQFLHTRSANPNVMLHVIQSDNTVVDGNHFVSSQGGDGAILIDDSMSVSVDNNTITIPNGGVGIFVENSIAIGNGNTIPGGNSSASITGNTITTTTGGFDFGIATIKSAGANLDVSIAENDLRQNQVGLFVQGAADGLGNIDAGSLNGSPGGNNFKGYIPGQTFAIGTVSSPDAEGNQVVQANFNIWDVSDPQTVVRPDFGTTIATNSWFSLLRVNPQILQVFIGPIPETNTFNILDHGTGIIGFSIGVDRAEALTFPGINEVQVETRAGSLERGHAVVNYQLNPIPGGSPADLEAHLGAYDVLNLDAVFASSSERLPARKWSVAVRGDGNNVVNTVLDGDAKTMPLDFVMDFGRGSHSFFNFDARPGALAAVGVAGSPIAMPTTITVTGSGADNHARLLFEGQNLGTLKIVADLETKMDTFAAMFPNRPLVPTRTALPTAGRPSVDLSVRAASIAVTMGNADESNLTTAFRLNLTGGMVAVDYYNLMINAPQMMTAEGGRLDVEFEHTTVAAPVYVDMDGGQTADTLLFRFAGLLNNKLHVRIDGGRSADTLISQFLIDAASTGALDAVERGHDGNDFLVFDVSFVNPDGSRTGAHHGRLRSFKALLDGGSGYNLYQATTNVDVRHAEPADPLRGR